MFWWHATNLATPEYISHNQFKKIVWVEGPSPSLALLQPRLYNKKNYLIGLVAMTLLDPPKLLLYISFKRCINGVGGSLVTDLAHTPMPKHLLNTTCHHILYETSES